MTDRIKDLLQEVADDVEPGDRIDAIRAATGVRRPGRGWWTAGGAGLVAASVVTALALTTGGDAPPEEPATSVPTTGAPVEVFGYYAGDTPDGQRLYRELRSVVAGDPFDAALIALASPPDDPDYVNLWPADAIQDVSFDGIGDDGLIGVTVDRSYATRPASMTPEQAGLAVEQVVRTLQTASASRAPVQFHADGSPLSQVLGVPTSEPLVPASDLSVLAHVSLTAPAEGQEVDNDDPFTVEGLGNSYEGNIVTRIQRLSGVVEVVAEEPTIAGTYEDRLFPFEVTFDLTTVPPGDYLVASRTDDPTGEQRFHVDDRRLTIVD